MQKYLFILMLGIALFYSIQSKIFAQNNNEKTIISVLDYGAVPNDSIDDQEAIQKAINQCKNKKHTTLLIPPGIYDIIDEKAIALMNDIMNWKYGKNPQDSIFTPYFPYAKGLDLSGLKDVYVKAQGAILLCSGWMEPVSLENCENITIEGLTIDYKTNPHSEGKVIQVKKKYIDVKLKDTRWLSDKMLMTRIMFWDLQKNRLLGM